MSDVDPSAFFARQEHDPGGSTSALLQRVREIGISRAGVLFKQALDAVDDALFGYSEKAEHAAAGKFIDAMRNLRVKRPDMETTFRECLSHRFGEFARHRGQGVALNARAIDADDLTLVLEEDLEEDLAVNGMAAKAKLRHHSALFALNQRLAVVLGTREVVDDTNPLGPLIVSQALKAAMSQFDAEVSTKIVMFKLFDRHVVHDLDQVYDETNRLLAKAGVLPHIKYSRPARDPGDAPSRPPTPTPSHGSSATVVEEDSAATELMSAIAGLFASRRRLGQGGAERRPTGPSISNSDLIAALSRMQNEILREDSSGGDMESPSERVDRVKRDLLEDLRHRGAAQPELPVAAADEDAIDLVGMLFQFVVQDRNLPSEIQAILSRLQIPYVRVAIKDKHLFAQKVHPARQLLNTLAVACVGWSKETDRDARFLTKLSETVQRVVEEYADDLALFRTLNVQFEAFLEQQKKHSQVAELRAADAAIGREKLAQARRFASQIVSSRIGKHQLPTLARDVLLNPWTNYMVLTHLRQGPGSSEWKSAVNFIDAVSWATLPKREAKDLERLRGLMPQMQAHLRRGLSDVGFSDGDSDGLVTGFGALFESMHQRQVSLECTASVVTAERMLETVKSKKQPAADLDAAPPESEPVAAEDDACVARVRALKIGTWIEFRGGRAPERAKLSWISPFTARYLFVNRKGLKVAERSVVALAKEFREGTANLLDVAPIFDRALDSIIDRLKEEQLQDYRASADLALSQTSQAGPGTPTNAR